MQNHFEELMIHANSSDRIFCQLSSDLTGIFSRNGQIQHMNSAWLEVLGWNQQELATVTWIDLVHPDDVNATLAAIDQQASSTTQPVTFENRVQHRHGHYHWLTWKVMITVDDLIYATAKDITDHVHRLQLEQEIADYQHTILSLRVENNQLEQQLQLQQRVLKTTTKKLKSESADRKQIASALAISDNRMKNLAANLPGAIFQFCCKNGKWQMDYISEGIWNIMGIHADDVIKDLSSFTARIHPQDIPHYLASVAESIDNLSPWHFEGRLIKPSGQEGWWQGDATPTQMPGGEIAFCGVLLDITERKHAEAALTQVRKELEVTVATRTQELQQVIHQLEQDKQERDWALQQREQVEIQLQESLQELAAVRFALDQSAIVDIFDANGVILCVNDNFCDISGYSRAELVGKTHQITGSGHHSAAFFDELWATISAGRVWKGEIKNRAKDGTFYWVETTIVPMLQSDGTPYQYISIRNNITERRQAESRLRKSEQFLRNIYEKVNHEIFVIDVKDEQDFIHAGLNPFAEQVTGFRSADIIGKSMQEIFGDDGDAIVQQYRNCIAAGTTIVYEECISFKGKPTWWLTTLNPLKDPFGKVYRLVGTAFDISDRIQAEQALRDSKQLLQLIFDTLPQRVFWKDMNLRYLGCNKLYAQDAGFSSPEELIGKDDFVIWPDTAVLYQKEDMALMQGDTSKINVEECRVQEDGSQVWIRNSMIPFHNTQGETIGIFGCYEDVTDEKRAQEQLRQSEQRFRDVSEAAGEYLWDFNANGVYTFVTDKSQLVKGYSPEILLGRSLFEFMPPGDTVIVRQILQSAIAAKQPFKLQHRTITPTGEIVWEEVNGVPRFDEQGNVVGFRGTGLSITERKQAEEALRQSEAELRQQTQELEQALHELQKTQTQLIQSEKMSSLGQLVAGVAHEINNPVNFIYGNLLHAEQYSQDLLELLQLYRQFAPSPPAHITRLELDIDLEFLINDLPKLLTSMKVGADRIRDIVQSLRTFSRLDEAEFKTVNLHDGLESTLLILQNRLKPKSNSLGIQIVKQYGELPPVECFAGQLNQVFMNILTNAIDALEETMDARDCDSESRLTPTITIHTELLNSNQVQISIADNGPGIPAHVQQRLFDPFFTTKQVGKGTGLGMSISYQIVTERHGGTLTCISAPGEGARFNIQIPIQQN